MDHSTVDQSAIDPCLRDVYVEELSSPVSIDEPAPAKVSPASRGGGTGFRKLFKRRQTEASGDAAPAAQTKQASETESRIADGKATTPAASKEGETGANGEGALVSPRAAEALARARARTQQPHDKDGRDEHTESEGGTGTSSFRPSSETTSQGSACGRCMCDSGPGQGRRWKQRLNMVLDIEHDLTLTGWSEDFPTRTVSLPMNGLLTELRDMFRILEGLALKARQESLTMEDIAWFYEWFEGFYGIVTGIFDLQEDVLFSWLENVGSMKLRNALAPKRRKTKQERAKNTCWDILELKMQFQKTANRRVSLEDLVQEMKDEAEQLSTRLLIYMESVEDCVPTEIASNFGPSEQDMIEAAITRTLLASQQGKFVIGTLARGIESDTERIAFLERSFALESRRKRRGPQRAYRKFHTRHVALADKLSVRPATVKSLLKPADGVEEDDDDDDDDLGDE